MTLRKHTARYDALFVDRYTWTAFRVYDFARLTCLVVNKNRGQMSAIMIDEEKKKKRKGKNFSSLRNIFTIFARNKFVKKKLTRSKDYSICDRIIEYFNLPTIFISTRFKYNAFAMNKQKKYGEK